mmetsp:Transcript_106634/g.200924  ORF Transcript_106634/g.200924 Transcript_106634/m.200924 type:complete len:207 (+) Transcript_106634:371-991(+)
MLTSTSPSIGVESFNAAVVAPMTVRAVRQNPSDRAVDKGLCNCVSPALALGRSILLPTGDISDARSSAKDTICASGPERADAPLTDLAIGDGTEAASPTAVSKRSIVSLISIDLHVPVMSIPPGVATGVAGKPESIKKPGVGGTLVLYSYKVPASSLVYPSSLISPRGPVRRISRSVAAGVTARDVKMSSSPVLDASEHSSSPTRL